MIELTHPWLLAPLVLLLPWVIWTEVRADGSRGRRLARAALRLSLLALVAMALAEPTRRKSVAAPRQRLVLAFERSRALGAQGAAEARDVAAAALERAAAEGAPVAALTYGRRGGPVETLAPRGGRGALSPEAPDDPEAWPERARPAAGLGIAALAFAPGETGTVLLLASGHGDLEGLGEAARAARDSGIRVLARALPATLDPAAAGGLEIEAVDLPPVVRGPFTIRLAVRGQAPLDVRALVAGRPVAQARIQGSGSRHEIGLEDLELEPGLHEIAIEVTTSGEASAEPAVLERRVVRVAAPPDVWVSASLPPMAPLRQALANQGFGVRDLPPSALGRDLAEGAPLPDLVVLDAAAALALGPDGQDALVTRIEAGLGVLLVAGLDESAWAGLADTPLSAALPVRPLEALPTPTPPPPPPPPTEPEPPVEKPEENDDPGLDTERRPDEALPISMLLVLDRSGSMQGPKLEMAIEGAKRSASALSRRDRIGVITFAEDASLDVPMTSVARLGNLGWRLTALQAAGNTDIYGALMKAAQVLAEESAPIRHLLLLTDGHQTGREAVFGHLVEQMGREGITLTAVGLGPGHDETLLKNIAMWAPRGHYRPADTEAQLPTILVRDTLEVVERRRQEAESLGPVRDPGRKDEPKPPEPQPPTPPPSEAPEVEGPDPQPKDVPDLARLVLVRPHEATAGLEAESLPAVGPARRSEMRPGGAVLMSRGAEEVALAAARHGLGRVLVWTLSDDAEGLRAWADIGRLIVQAARSVRAPAGLGQSVFASVLLDPDGDRLRLDAAPGAPASPVRVLWSGAGEEHDLGLHTPGTGEDLRLPTAAAGTAAWIQLRDEEGHPTGPGLTYLVSAPRVAGPRAGDATRLASVLGAEALQEGSPLFAPAPEGQGREGLWALFSLLALLLLPFDVALHRRAGRST